MHLQRTYTGPEAQHYALEPPPFGTGLSKLAYEPSTVLVYLAEPSDPGHHFAQLLAPDADRYEAGGEQIGGWRL